MDYLTLINPLALLVAGVIYTLLGSLWYSPWLFGKDWLEYCGLKSEDCKCCSSSFLWAFLNSLVIALGLSVLVILTGAVTAGEGACLAFWAWLGFVATTLMSGVIWEKRSFHWWLINAGFSLVGLLIIGALLAVWR